MDELNPLFIGFDVGEVGRDIPTLNVFRKVGDTFRIVKIINGDEAVKLYFKLTREDDVSAPENSV